MRLLVAIASYGRGNDRYLERLLEEYRSMSFDVDIVILSNIEKNLGLDVEMLIGLPNKDPWSLPFAHKKLFVERAEDYDLFVYSEDDVLISEKHLRAFLEVTAELNEDEIPGFLRFEEWPDGHVSFPEVHWTFHWESQSVRSRGKHVLAEFSNEHAACYVLTREQLAKAIRSGGFLVEPHEGKYDLLCSAATDPYTQCGLTKLIPISHFDDFTVHHLPNRYAGRFGIDEGEMRSQVGAMLKLAADAVVPVPLLDRETKLWRRMFSKDYYERIDQDVLSAIPSEARTVLSVGCGSGALECALVERGMQVAAVPLDPVICGGDALKGVEMVHAGFHAAATKLGDRTFDCILFLNMLHLVPDPVEILSEFRGVMHEQSVMIIQSPNMRSIPEMWRRLRYPSRYRGLGRFEQSGVHIAGAGKIADWCGKSGLSVDRNIGLLHKRARAMRGRARFVELMMSPSFISIVRPNSSAGYRSSVHESAGGAASLKQPLDHAPV